MKFPPVNEFFGRILSVDPNVVTLLVIATCVWLAWASIFSKKHSRRFREIAPTLMVSAGIIGTFWGTFNALSDFQTVSPDGGLDHNAMVESIPAVLGGMKTAFITTLIGLLSAFSLKVKFRFSPQPQHEPLQIEKDSIELLQQIKDGIVGENDKSLSSKMSVLQAEYRDGAESLKQSISGENETSVATQLLKLRNENSDNFKRLDGNLESLTKTIHESLVKNMEELMKELRNVIVDHLAKQLEETNKLLRDQLTAMLDRIEEALIKQFGETFKQFNEATQAIKKWQEDHRQHVEELTTAFESTARGIERIRAECESIPAAMEQLKNLMGELDQRLQAFADMKQSAEQSFPVIKEHLDSIGSNLEKSAAGFSGLQETISETHAQAGNLAQQHIEVAQKHIEQVNLQINRTAEKIAETSAEMIAESKNASAQYRQDIQEVTRAVTRESERCVEETQATLHKLANQHAQTVNNAMEGIADRWGKIMLGIAERIAQVISDQRR